MYIDQRERLAELLPFKVLFAGFVALVVVIELPLLGTHLMHPFKHWDYLAAVPYENFHFKPYDSWETVWPNFYYLLIETKRTFRPLFGLFHQIQLIVFGGEFWVYLLLKWVMKVGTVAMIYGLLRRFSACREAALAGACFAMFHPAPMMVDLFSTELYASFFMLSLVCMTPAFVDAIGGNERRRNPATRCAIYLGFMMLWCTVLFFKEVFLTFGLVWMVHLFFSSGTPRQRFLALIPPFLVVAGSFYRLKECLATRPRYSDSVTATLAEWGDRIADHLFYFQPTGLFNIVGAALALLLIACIMVFSAQTLGALPRGDKGFVRNTWLKIEQLAQNAPFMMSMSAFAILLAISVPSSYPPHAKPRYVIPVVILFAVVWGLGLEHLSRRFKPVVWAAILIFPISVAHSQYYQLLSVTQIANGFSVYINRLVEYSENQLPIASTGEGEKVSTVENFFGELGRELYGHDLPAIRPLTSVANEEERFVLITEHPPYEVLGGVLDGVSPAAIDRVDTVIVPHLGGFEILAGFWEDVAKKSGSFAIPTIHEGGFWGTYPVQPWFIYLIDQTKTSSLLSDPRPLSDLRLNGEEIAPLHEGGEEQFRALDAQGVHISARLPALEGARNSYQINGTMEVHSGSVWMGIVEEGKGTISEILQVTPFAQFHPIPTPLVAGLSGDKHYILEFHGAEGTSFVLAGRLSSSLYHTRRITPTVRYGAFIR